MSGMPSPPKTMSCSAASSSHSSRPSGSLFEDRSAFWGHAAVLLTSGTGERTVSNSCLSDQVGDLQEFIKEYNLQCPMAVQRLVASGMPATVEHGKPSGASQNIARLAAETVQYFITAMDAVKMKMAAADEVSCLEQGSCFRDNFPAALNIA